jgi:biopolymer transport protein ExbD
MIEMPGSSAKDDRPLRVVTDRQVKEAMIKVTARMNDGKTEIKVENDVVDEAYLRAKLSQYRKDTRKTNLLIDAEGVDLGTLVGIQDAAKGAGLDRVYYASKNPTPP